jgi:hypothetical protein
LRIEERTCPFCAADVQSAMAEAPSRALPKQRIGRAALMSFGLTVGVAVAGCNDDGDDQGPSTDAQVKDAAATLDAARAEDASLPSADAAADAAMPERDAGKAEDAGHVDAGRDAEVDSGPHVVPLYGAPVPIYGAPATKG